MNDPLTLSVSDFVVLCNQTFEYAYPTVTIVGELANLRISKNKWVYFDLKDESASVKFFGTIYQLPGPLEDGLLLQVTGAPRLHPLYGFSVNVQSMQPVGEGSLRRAAALLEAKLLAEGLFDPERKRTLQYPPAKIGLVTSSESAAYHDFIKILGQRFGGIEIVLVDVQVQGEQSPSQIVRAIEHLNTHVSDLEVIVVTRGGGSADDLAAFSAESVVRAVAGSRIPTLVAIGHEVDISLAELAADQRASTPSNAAELLVPDMADVLRTLQDQSIQLGHLLSQVLKNQQATVEQQLRDLSTYTSRIFERQRSNLDLQRQLLTALDPLLVLKRGYAVVSQNGKTLRSLKQLKTADSLTVRLSDGQFEAIISS